MVSQSILSLWNPTHLIPLSVVLVNLRNQFIVRLFGNMSADEVFVFPGARTGRVLTIAGAPFAIRDGQGLSSLST